MAAPPRASSVEFWRQRARLGDLGHLFEMVADAVGEFAVVDEQRGAAGFRHQRIGQRQWRVRDVAAADVEGPRHRVRIRQHQRVDAELGDLGADPLQLLAFRFARELLAVKGDGRKRRGGALGPDRVQRIAVDRDHLRARLGAGGREPLGGRRRVQPRIEPEAVAGHQMLAEPGFGWRLHQRLDAPGLGVDLLSRLQRIAAIDEDGGLPGQHDGKAGGAGEAGQPRQPLFRWRNIFVLLLIGARDHEPGQVASRQFLAKCG